MGERGLRGLIARLGSAGRELDARAHAFYLRRDGPLRPAPWIEAAPEREALAPFLAPAGHALDLGCGGARNAIHLAHAGWRVLGVDLYPWTVARARARVRAAGVDARVHVVRGAATELEVPEAGFDLALDVLGPASDLRARDLAQYARGVARSLRPEGRLLMQTFLRDEELGPLQSHLRCLETTEDPLARWLVYAPHSGR